MNDKILLEVSSNVQIINDKGQTIKKLQDVIDYFIELYPEINGKDLLDKLFIHWKYYADGYQVSIENQKITECTIYMNQHNIDWKSVIEETRIQYEIWSKKMLEH